MENKNKFGQFLLFGLTSVIASAVDYLVFTGCSFLTKDLSNQLSVTISNVAAKIIGVSVNYVMKRKLVFKSDADLVKSSIQFFALAFGILIGSTVVINLLTGPLKINRYIAKVITETMFFFVNWFVQKLMIFAKKDKVPEDELIA